MKYNNVSNLSEWAIILYLEKYGQVTRKQLAKDFVTKEDMLKRLQKPILLKAIPLGKHKGRSFDEIPLEYLYWAVKKISILI